MQLFRVALGFLLCSSLFMVLRAESQTRESYRGLMTPQVRSERHPGSGSPGGERKVRSPAGLSAL